MALDDLARERQADPRPAPVILAIMQPPENLEDHVLIIFRNTDAVVAHVVMQGLARINANLDPLIGLVIVFDGVPDEVEEDIARTRSRLQSAVPSREGRRTSTPPSARA